MYTLTLYFLWQEKDKIYFELHCEDILCVSLSNIFIAQGNNRRYIYIFCQLKIHTSKIHISFPCTVEYILEEVDPLSKGYYEKYILIKIVYFFGRGWPLPKGYYGQGYISKVSFFVFVSVFFYVIVF